MIRSPAFRHSSLGRDRILLGWHAKEVLVENYFFTRWILVYMGWVVVDHIAYLSDTAAVFICFLYVRSTCILAMRLI
jgi:hypothetical protein